jgi:hypothetical protein
MRDMPAACTHGGFPSAGQGTTSPRCVFRSVSRAHFGTRLGVSSLLPRRGFKSTPGRSTPLTHGGASRGLIWWQWVSGSKWIQGTLRPCSGPSDSVPHVRAIRRCPELPEREQTAPSVAPCDPAQRRLAVRVPDLSNRARVPRRRRRFSAEKFRTRLMARYSRSRRFRINRKPG